MPEALITEGDKTVNIPVQGGEPGEGKNDYYRSGL